MMVKFNTIFWTTLAVATGEDVGGGAQAGDSGRAELAGSDEVCRGVTVSLEEGVKAVEMEEFNISLTVSLSSSAATPMLLTVAPNWDGLKVLEGGQIQVRQPYDDQKPNRPTRPIFKIIYESSSS